MTCSHQRTTKWLNELICFRTYLMFLERRGPKLRSEGVASNAKSKKYLEEGQVSFPVVDVIHTAYPNVYLGEMMYRLFSSTTNSGYFSLMSISSMLTPVPYTQIRVEAETLWYCNIFCVQKSACNVQKAKAFSLAVPQSGLQFQ